MTAPSITATEPIEAVLDLPIRYIDRSRAYYLALGYDNPYRWAQNESVPFAAMPKPLRESRVALITTAAPFQPGAGDQGAWAPYNATAKFSEVYALPVEPAPDLRISHVGYDRKHTSAEDSNSYFPLARIQEAVAARRVGELSTRLIGVPTLRSQRLTTERDAPRALELLREDGVDAAVLVPNCPVCHQTISLTARYLEANGIATVVMGCARDIVEQAGVPRLLFSDYPLGNSAGRPNDVENQRAVLGMALDLLESATAARTTVQSPFRWADDATWKRDFYRLDMSPDQVAHARSEMDSQKAILAAKLDATPGARRQ
ncbi:MAG: glycine reductase [Tepidiformaceae bacterium]